MVVKVYISGISGNKEVKKRQQRVILILESKNVPYELLDIAEPNMEQAKEYMQTNSKLNGCTIGDPNPRHPLPPQIFNDEEYCGDYDAFDMANEIDEMEKFLKLAPGEIIDPLLTSTAEVKLENGDVPNGKSKESSIEKEEYPNQTVEEEKNEEIVENTNEVESERAKSLSPENKFLEEERAASAGLNETDDEKAENAAANGNSKDEVDEE